MVVAVGPTRQVGLAMVGLDHFSFLNYCHNKFSGTWDTLFSALNVADTKILFFSLVVVFDWIE